jgi:hypothetical protein
MSQRSHGVGSLILPVLLLVLASARALDALARDASLRIANAQGILTASTVDVDGAATAAFDTSSQSAAGFFRTKPLFPRREASQAERAETALKERDAAIAGASVVGFGFPSNYVCSGRVFDEPRRMRLKCTKNIARQMNCHCDGDSNTRLVQCSCDPTIGNRIGQTPLVNKFVGNQTLFPSNIELPPANAYA